MSSRLDPTLARWIQLERDQHAPSASEQQRHLASTLVAHLRTVRDTPRPIAVDTLEPLAIFLSTHLPTLYDPTYPHASHALEATVTIITHALLVELPLLWDPQVRKEDFRGGPAFVGGREREGDAWMQVIAKGLAGIFAHLENNNEVDERGSVVKDQPHRGMVAQAVLKDNLLLLFSESAWRLPGSLKYAAIDLMGETLSKHGPNKQYLRSLVSIPQFTQILDESSDYFVASAILETGYRLIPTKAEYTTTTKSAYCEELLTDAVSGPLAPELRKSLFAASGESYFDHARVMLKAIGRTKNTRFQAFETLETYYTHNEKQLSGVDEQSTDWWICRDMVATEVDDQDVEGCYVGGRFVLAFDSVDRVEVVQGTDDTVTTFFMSRPATIANEPLHGPKSKEGNKVTFRTAAKSYDGIVRTLVDRSALYPQLRPVGLPSPAKPRKSSQAGPITKAIPSSSTSPPPSSKKNAENERRARELAVIAEVDRSDSDSSVEIVEEVSEIKSTTGNIEESLDDIVPVGKFHKGKAQELTTVQLPPSNEKSILLVANTPDQPEAILAAASTAPLSEISSAESLSSHSILAPKVDPLPFDFAVKTTSKAVEVGRQVVESKQVGKKATTKGKDVAPPAPHIPAAKPTKLKGGQNAKEGAPLVASPRKTRSGVPFSVSPSGPPPPFVPKPRPITAKRPRTDASSDSDVVDDSIVPERKRAKVVEVPPPKGSVTEEMDETSSEESAALGRTTSLAPIKKVAPLKQKYGKEKPRRSTLTRAEIKQAQEKGMESELSDETDYSDEEQVSIVGKKVKASTKEEKKRDDLSQVIEDSQPTIETSMDRKGKGKEREEEREKVKGTRESMKGDKGKESQVIGKKAAQKGGARASAASTSKPGQSSKLIQRAQVQDDSDPTIVAAASVAKSWSRGHPPQNNITSYAELVDPARQRAQQESPRAVNPFQSKPKPVTFRVDVESEPSKLLRRVSADSHPGESTFSPMLDPAQDDTFVDRAVGAVEAVEDDEPSSFFDQTLPRDTLRIESGETHELPSHESFANDDDDQLEGESGERAGDDAPEVAAGDDVVNSPTPESISDDRSYQHVEMLVDDPVDPVKVARVDAATAAASRSRIVESKGRSRTAAMELDERDPVDDSGIFFEDDVVAARDSIVDAGSPQGLSSSPSLTRSIAVAVKKPTTDSARSQPVAKHLAPSPVIPLRRSRSAVEKVAPTEVLPSKKPRIVLVKPTQIVAPPKKAKPVSASSNGVASSSQHRKGRSLAPAPRRRSPSVRSEAGRSTSRGRSADRDVGVARRSTSRGDSTREAEVEDEEEEDEEGGYDEMQEMRENLDELTSIILARHAEKSAQTARQFQDSVSFLNYKAAKYLRPVHDQSTLVIEQTQMATNNVMSKMDAALAAMEAFRDQTASVLASVTSKKK